MMLAAQWPIASGGTGGVSDRAPLPPQAEPTVWSQLWRTARTLGVTFLIIAGLGALMEEKGLSRGMLANPDMTPQLETATKFADVKGVDEAKVRVPLPGPGEGGGGRGVVDGG